MIIAWRRNGSFDKKLASTSSLMSRDIFNAIHPIFNGGGKVVVEANPTVGKITNTDQPTIGKVSRSV